MHKFIITFVASSCSYHWYLPVILFMELSLIICCHLRIKLRLRRGSLFSKDNWFLFVMYTNTKITGKAVLQYHFYITFKHQSVTVYILKVLQN